MLCITVLISLTQLSICKWNRRVYAWYDLKEYKREDLVISTKSSGVAMVQTTKDFRESIF